MLALNVTQRTEDKLITQQEQNGEKLWEEEAKDAMSYWLMNTFSFPFSRNLEKTVTRPLCFRKDRQKGTDDPGIQRCCKT